MNSNGYKNKLFVNIVHQKVSAIVVVSVQRPLFSDARGRKPAACLLLVIDFRGMSYMSCNGVSHHAMPVCKRCFRSTQSATM